MPDPNGGNGYTGFEQPSDFLSEFNAAQFMLQAMISKIRTMTVVEVMATTNAGAVAPPGFVNIMPLVNQVDGAGNAFPHGVIYTCPVWRLQGGINAVILDPVVGDLGVAVFADRDISSVTANKAQANPGSRRMYDWADAIYFGGVLNPAPTQFIAFAASGIRISSPTQVELDAPDVHINASTFEVSASTSATVTAPTITLNGATTVAGTFAQTGGGASTMSGSLTTTGNVTGGGKSLDTHTHSGVTTGAGNTGPPN